MYPFVVRVHAYGVYCTLLGWDKSRYVQAIARSHSFHLLISLLSIIINADVSCKFSNFFSTITKSNRASPEHPC